MEIVMEAGMVIFSDFRSRLETARYGRLRDEELFFSVSTDGSSLICDKSGKVPVSILVQGLLDLVLMDRTKATAARAGKNGKPLL